LLGNQIRPDVDRDADVVVVSPKSGATLNRDFFKGLLYFRELAGKTLADATLVHGGSDTTTHQGRQILPGNAVATWQHSAICQTAERSHGVGISEPEGKSQSHLRTDGAGDIVPERAGGWIATILVKVVAEFPAGDAGGDTGG
jgi:hypothetical protein